MKNKVEVRQMLKRLKEAELMPDTHLLYKPLAVPVLSYDQIMDQRPKFAAVNILLYYKDGEWYFPLIVRKRDSRDKHSGQIALPGGKKEESDASFAETAIRETYEEVGIKKEAIRVIREISPIYIPPSNFYVRAFISYTSKPPEFKLQESEVAGCIEFPVSNLLSTNEQPVMMPLSSTGGVPIPVITLNDHIIWGATSMILSEFRQLIQKIYSE